MIDVSNIVRTPQAEELVDAYLNYYHIETAATEWTENFVDLVQIGMNNTPDADILSNFAKLAREYPGEAAETLWDMAKG